MQVGHSDLALKEVGNEAPLGRTFLGLCEEIVF
jgi:hypothetical protein